VPYGTELVSRGYQALRIWLPSFSPFGTNTLNTCRSETDLRGIPQLIETLVVIQGRIRSPLQGEWRFGRYPGLKHLGYSVQPFHG
jgi:hypothetical protein